MNYIAIDTCGNNLTVIVKKQDEFFEYYDGSCGASHSVKIMPVIEDLMIKAGLEMRDLDFVAVVVGPGSFTGIRIGISTAKALAFANNLKVLSITSFDCLAYNKQEGKTLAVIDANHNGFYACGYDDLKVVFEPCYIMKERLLQITGDFNVVSHKDVDGLDVEVVSVVEGLKNAIERKYGDISEDVNSLTALYCRKSQAEEGRL